MSLAHGATRKKFKLLSISEMDNTIYFLSLWELTIDAFIETRNFSFQLSSFQVQNLFDKTFTSSTRTAFPLGFPNFRKLKCSWSIVLQRIVQLTWAVNTEAISGVSHNLSFVILPVKLTEFATHSSGAVSLPMFVTFGYKDIDEEVTTFSTLYLLHNGILPRLSPPEFLYIPWCQPSRSTSHQRCPDR